MGKNHPILLKKVSDVTYWKWQRLQVLYRARNYDELFKKVINTALRQAEHKPRRRAS